MQSPRCREHGIGQRDHRQDPRHGLDRIRHSPECLGTSLDFVGGTGTPVGRTVAEEFLDRSEVHGPTLGLMHRRAIPIEPQPLERAEDDVDQFRPRPLGVGVFDTQNELAALLAGKEPVEEGGSRPTNMEIARRGRGEADSSDWGVHRVDGTVRPSLIWSSHRFRADFPTGPPSPLFARSTP
jgi:hypothetical protein